MDIEAELALNYAAQGAEDGKDLGRSSTAPAAGVPRVFEDAKKHKPRLSVSKSRRRRSVGSRRGSIGGTVPMDLLKTMSMKPLRLKDGKPQLPRLDAPPHLAGALVVLEEGHELGPVAVGQPWRLHWTKK